MPGWAAQQPQKAASAVQSSAVAQCCSQGPGVRPQPPLMTDSIIANINTETAEKMENRAFLQKVRTHKQRNSKIYKKRQCKTHDTRYNLRSSRHAVARC